MNTLKIFEDFFNSTLGMWNTATMDLDVNDDYKRVCLLPYPLPMLHEAIVRNEVERLVKKRSAQRSK